MERITGGTGRQMNSTYVYGTAARMLNPAMPKVKDAERIQRENEQRERERLASSRALHRAHRVNLLYTIVAVAVVSFMFGVCVQYLEMQANVKTAANDVARLEARLTQLTVKNDETKMEIEGSVDYDALLKTAVEELGMVYPKRSQIVEYDSTESEYVKQYKDIPSTKK